MAIRRVRLKLIIDQYLLHNTAEYEKRSYLRGNGLVIRDARFVRVEDCDLYASKEGDAEINRIASEIILFMDYSFPSAASRRKYCSIASR